MDLHKFKAPQCHFTSVRATVTLKSPESKFLPFILYYVVYANKLDPSCPYTYFYMFLCLVSASFQIIIFLFIILDITLICFQLIFVKFKMFCFVCLFIFTQKCPIVPAPFVNCSFSVASPLFSCQRSFDFICGHSFSKSPFLMKRQLCADASFKPYPGSAPFS